MRSQILLTTKYIEQGSIQQLVVPARRIIFDNDIFQLGQLGIDLVMVTGKNSDAVIFQPFSLQQMFHISKYLFILIFHVLAYLVHVCIEKLHNQKSDFILR